MASTVTWRPTDDMEAWMKARAERAIPPQGMSARTRVEMELWRSVLSAELADHEWSLDELGTMADICNGAETFDRVPFQTGAGFIAAELAYAFTSNPGAWHQEWGVDEQALLAKVTALGPAADMALNDALVRWWAQGADHSAWSWSQLGVRVAINEPLQSLTQYASEHNLDPAAMLQVVIDHDADIYGTTDALIRYRGQQVQDPVMLLSSLERAAADTPTTDIP